jgi:hypothetical protein
MLPRYLDSLMAQHRQLWFPAHQTGGRILETEIQSYLAQHYHTLISEWSNPHTRLWLFGAEDNLAASEAAVNFANMVRLVGHGVSRGPVATGSPIDIELRWQAAAVIKDSLYVGLRLVDDSNYTWYQRSAEPVAGLRPFTDWPVGETVADRQGLLVPIDAPPGRYAIRLGIYRKSNDRGLDVLGPNGAPQGVEVSLGSVDVVPTSEPPGLVRLQVPHPMRADFVDSLVDPKQNAVRFLGYSLLGSNYTPGSELQIALFWQPQTHMTQDNLAVLELLDEGGRLTATSESSPVLTRYPMSRWESLYPLRDPRRLIVPPAATQGRYRLRLTVSPPDRHARFQIRGTGRDFLELTTVQVTGGRAHDFTAPRVGRSLSAVIRREVKLLGYDPLPDKIAAGGMLHLTLYWQALASMPTSYTVFVHLLDQNERLWGQVDSLPGNGTLPTTGWVPEEYLQDTYSFQVKPDAPAGRYRIEVGMYEAATGTRRPIQLEGTAGVTDRILLDQDLWVAPTQ